MKRNNLQGQVVALETEKLHLENEIERLNKGYCKFKEQCGKYATCSRENQLKEIERLNEDNEYLNKVNIELSTEKNRLNNIIEEAIKGIEDYYYGDEEYKKYDYTLAYQIYHILKGSDKK